MLKKTSLLTLLGLMFLSCHKEPKTIRLDQMNTGLINNGWGYSQPNKSISGKTLSISGETFSHGVGTHATSVTVLKLDGEALRFQAKVGIDDGATEKGSCEFLVLNKDHILWRSGRMVKGDPAQSIDLDLRSQTYLGLLVLPTEDGNKSDHANWCETSITYEGAKPAITPNMADERIILTPKEKAAPRINGPHVYGVRPGNPFLYTVPTSGERPISFSVQNLPEGLSLNEKTGQITGAIKKPGNYQIILQAKNNKGTDQQPFTIKVGEAICLTPPLGWNSWYCWSESVSQENVLQIAKAFVDKGLVNYGWTYINIDDCWQGERRGKRFAIQGNERFPDMKAMCDSIHQMGLKVGIYSTPWMGSYAGFIGGSAPNPNADYSQHALPPQKRLQPHQFFGRYPGTLKKGLNKVGPHWFADNDHKQWAEWGFDYVKYDWNPNDVPTTRRLAESLRSCGRDIILSLSNTAPFENVGELAKYAQLWRTTGDIHDSWSSITNIGFNQDRWAPYGGTGHWNDPDMLQIGKKGIPNKQNRRLKKPNLSPNEQYSQVSLWSLLSAPLLLSCDIESMDDFTLGLIKNAEVLAVNQDPLGKQAKKVFNDNGVQVFKKELENGDFAIGVFYTHDTKPMEKPHDYLYWGEAKVKEITLNPEIIKLSGTYKVRDLWRQKELGVYNNTFSLAVPWHGVRLLRFSKR